MSDFDLDKVLAEEDDERKPYTFTFDGDDYELPPNMDVRAVAAIAGGRLDDGLRLLLGPAQWTKLQEAEKVFTMQALEKLFESYSAFTGVETVGKSSVSTLPSKRAAKR